MKRRRIDRNKESWKTEKWKKRLKPFSAIIQKGQKVVDAKRTRKRRWEWNNPICWEKWPKNVQEKGCYLLRVILNKGLKKQLNSVHIFLFFIYCYKVISIPKKRRKKTGFWNEKHWFTYISFRNSIKIYCLCYFFFLLFFKKHIVKECQLDLFQILSGNINGNFLNRKKILFPQLGN